MSSKKPHLNMIMTGHVDHGKSTLVGHLLFETGAIDVLHSGLYLLQLD